MKQREYRIGPGAASLLLVVVVVSMSVLGLLALINARGDYKLTQRAEAFVVSEYAASVEAEAAVAELDGILAEYARTAQEDKEYLLAVSGALPESMQINGRTVSWEHPADNGRALKCAVEISPLGSEVRYAWKEHVFIAETGMDDVFD